MVIGNGLVATGFAAYKNNDKVVVFASGVSNSGNTDQTAFSRESSLLNQTLDKLNNRLLIYISTCSIYDPSLQDSLYVQHKLAMEKLVLNQATRYYIFRVPNLAGHTNNPHTILNYFSNHILSDKPFFVWKNAYRNIIDIEDAVQICSYFIEHLDTQNKTINVANLYSYSVYDIVRTIEEKLHKKGNYTLVDKGSSPLIDTGDITPVINKLGINFTGNYLEKIIKKYLV